MHLFPLTPNLHVVTIEQGADYARAVHVEAAHGNVTLQDIVTEDGQPTTYWCNTIWTPAEAERVAWALLAAVKGARV